MAKHREGDPCRRCGGTLIRTSDGERRVARRRRKAQQRGSYYYIWVLKCDKCRRIYNDSSALDYPPSASETSVGVHLDQVEALRRLLLIAADHEHLAAPDFSNIKCTQSRGGLNFAFTISHKAFRWAGYNTKDLDLLFGSRH